MNRLAVAGLGLVALAGAGLGGFWWYNQNVARGHFEGAIASLAAAGVDMKYDSLEIGGFPLSTTGTLTNVAIRVPARSLAFTFPELAAGMSVASIGAVDFTLPPEFFVDLLDGAGAPTGGQLFVKSEGLTTSVSPTAANSYDLALAAKTLRLAPAAGGKALDDHIEFAAVSVDGALTADPATGTVTLDAKLAADALAAMFAAAAAEGAPPTSVELTAKTVSATAAGDLAKMATKISAASVDMVSGQEATASLGAVTLDLSATPEGGFDPAELFALRDAPNLAQAILGLLGRTVVDGGALDFDLGVGSIAVDAVVVPGDASQRFTLASTDFVMSSDAGPRLLGAGMQATKLKFEVQGADSVFYDVDGMKLLVETTATDKFDFAPIALAPDGESAGAATVEMLKTAIVGGGSATALFSSTRYDTVTPMPPLSAPFELLKSSAGPNKTEVRLTKERASVEATGDGLVYEMQGGFEGKVEVATIATTATMPMIAAAGPQAARIVTDLAGFTLSDSIWAAFDPESKLPREIEGLGLEMDLGMVLFEDLWNVTPGTETPPAMPESIDLKRFTLGMLGLRGSAAGKVALSPAPDGLITVNLTGWRAFSEAFATTPFGQDPQAQTMALMATSWLDAFGAPGATPEETVLAVAFTPAGLTINGKPLDGAAGDTTSDPSAQDPNAADPNAPTPNTPPAQ